MESTETKVIKELKELKEQPFFMLKKKRLDELMTKADKSTVSPKVAHLVISRAQDDDTYLPVFPSAQMWRNMTDDEKDEFVNVVEKSGKKWKAYENDMKALWPRKGQ